MIKLKIIIIKKKQYPNIVAHACGCEAGFMFGPIIIFALFGDKYHIINHSFYIYI